MGNNTEISQSQILINNKIYNSNIIYNNADIFINIKDLEQAGFKIGHNSENQLYINCTHINSINTPVNEKNTIHYLYDRYDVIEVSPLDIIIKKANGNLNKVEDKNVINVGFSIQQKDGTAIPKSILVNDGKFLQYSDTILSNKTPHNKPIGSIIIYKDGTVRYDSIKNIDENELSNINTVMSGLTILPAIITRDEGFEKGTSEDGKDYTDITRAANRVVIGYNQDKNKIVFVSGIKMSAADGKIALQKLGCKYGIAPDVGGHTIVKINNKYIIQSDNRPEFAYITF